MLNEFYIVNEFDSRIRRLCDSLEKSAKKGEAREIYRAISEMCKLGKECDIINAAAYDIYMERARDALYTVLH